MSAISVPYTKEFEKIILGGEVSQSLKNVAPNSTENLFIRFITELKKCQTQKKFSKELKEIYDIIQKEKISQSFKNDCELRMVLFEFDLESTTKERKKEIIDYFHRLYCGSKFEHAKPDFATKFKTETKDKKDELAHPTKLTPDMLKEQTTKFLNSRSKNEYDRFRYYNNSEKHEIFKKLIKEKKSDEIVKIIKGNFYINFYTFDDDIFNKFIDILNSLTNTNLDNNINYNSFTLKQIEKLNKNLKNSSILDKNLIITAFINKKYEPQLENCKEDPTQQRETLKAIYNEAKALDAPSNYLSSILYQILTIGRDINVYDYELFIEYLKNPLNISIIHMLKSKEQLMKNLKQFSVNQIDVDFRKEIFINDYLHYFFYNKKATPSNFDKYIETEYLEKEFFISSILRGDEIQYDPVHHAKIISKDNYESLCKKRELTICEHNKKNFNVNEEIVLDFDIKNINTMSVSVFEINTENYYLNKKAAITSLIVVEGLITAWESNFSFNEKPSKRTRRSITLDKIPKRRGVYLIEIMGNGISSRAIIKKGALSLVARPTPKGKLCYIVNEENEIVKSKDTYMWYNGSKIYCEENSGMILIPYINNSSNINDNFCILSHDGFCDFAKFEPQPEFYNLKGTFILNHESLVTGNIAKILFKPMLTVNSREISISNVKKPKINVHMTKRENDTIVPIDNEIEVKFDLGKSNEIEFEVQIPPMLMSLEYTFTCDIFNNSTKKDQPLSVTQKEQIDTSKENILNFFLRKEKNNLEDQYVLELVGRNGEKSADTAVKIELISKEVSIRQISFTMETDENGEIHLCNLNDYERLKVYLAATPLIKKEFALDSNAHYSYPETIDGVNEETFTLPYYTFDEKKDNYGITLVKHQNGNVIDNLDITEFITVTPREINKNDKNYYILQISKLTVGKYYLYLNNFITKIKIDIHSGKKWVDNDFIIDKNVIIENAQHRNPIHLTSLKLEQSKIKFTASSTSSHQRAHLFIYHYLPNSPLYLSKKIETMMFNDVDMNNEQPLQSWKNIYLSNRILNEEIQYVLERKNYDSQIGNSLEMPSLVLKRQFTKESHIENEELAKGTKYEKKDANAQGRSSKKENYKSSKSSDAAIISDFQNFISVPAITSINVLPDDKGNYEVDFKADSDFTNLQIILIDDRSISSDIITLDSKKVNKRTMVNENVLDNSKNFTEIRKIEKKLKNEKFCISEDSSFKLVDSIEKVINYYMVKSSGLKSKWEEIKFVLDSDTIDEDKFLEKYSSFISHEVNLFLYFKHKKLFDKIVKPIIKFKIEKTFIDYFLLDDIETLKMYLKPEKLQKLNNFQLCLLILKFVSSSPETAQTIRNLIKSNVNTDDIEGIISGNFDVMMNMKNDTDDKLKKLMEEKKEIKKEMAKEVAMEEECYDECLDDDQIMDNGNCFGGPTQYGNEFRNREAPQMNRFSNQFVQPQVLMTQACMESNIAPMMPLSCVQSRAMPPSQMMQPRMMMCQSDFASSISNTFQPPGVALFSKLDQNVDYSKAAKIARVNDGAQYEKPGCAKEYKERHYLYKNHKETFTSPLWLELADHIILHKTKDGFLSKYILNSLVNINEFIWILCVLDLPIHNAKHIYNRIPGRKIEITPSSNLLLFTKEISEAKLELNTKILISQNIALPNKSDANVAFDNVVKNTIYSHETIVTNVSSKKIEFDLFIQIPEGAIPMKGSFYTQTHHMSLSGYQTLSYQSYFYFPQEGTFKQYHPVATKEANIISIGESFSYHVKESVSFDKKTDKEDDLKKKKLYDPNKLKEIISKGDKKDIIKYFENEPYNQDDIKNILWLLKDKDFYSSLIKILREKGTLYQDVWAFGFFHYDEKVISEYLNLRKDIKTRLGPEFNSSLISNSNLDASSLFTHLEYAPLFNARVHPLGKSEIQIANDNLARSYQSFIINCFTMQSLSQRVLLQLTYYLILQERIEEATSVFSKVNPKEVTDTLNYKIQYDYLSAYLDMSNGLPEFKIAKSVCTQYKNFPLLYWRERFEEIEDQLFEYEGKEIVSMLDVENQTLEGKTDKEIKKDLQAAQPSLSFSIDKTKLVIVHSNIKKISIKFYLIDLEILFSRCPSLKSRSNDFSFVQPNFSKEIEVKDSKGMESIENFEIPSEFATKNIFIEVSSGSIKVFETYFSANLNLIINENIGEVKVLDSQLKPVLKAYVKCYVNISGQIKFYKDGYTDLRGKFNYLALNTDQLQSATRFYIFVSDDKLGAMIKECRPPYNLGGKTTEKNYDSLMKYKQQQKVQWRMLNKK